MIFIVFISTVFYFRHYKGTPLGSLSFPVMQEGYQKVTPVSGNKVFKMEINPSCNFTEVPSKKYIQNRVKKMTKKRGDEYLFDYGTVIRHYLLWFTISDDFGQPVFEKYVIFSRPGISGCRKLNQKWKSSIR